MRATAATSRASSTPALAAPAALAPARLPASFAIGIVASAASPATRVVGRAQSEHCRITPLTRTLLRVRVSPLEPPR